jgi:hypothetical protein
MSWTDKKVIEQITKLRDLYKSDYLVETGTFMGVNAAVHAHNFKYVFTCELVEEYYNKANKRLKQFSNVTTINQSSVSFLKDIVNIFKAVFIIYGTRPIIYLDAHFYDPALPKEDRFVVLKELKSLEGLAESIIIIHDFKCNGLGHIVYDGQPLNFELLKDGLYGVNPNFHFYCNTKETCDIMTEDRIRSGEIPGLEPDDYTIDNIKYAWSDESKTYRGLLYCTPTELDLSNFDLVKYTE